MKKGFVLLLALCLLGLLGWAFAEETVDVGDCTYAIADGEAKLTAIGDRAFENCTELRLVMIGESLTQIGEDAFKGCDKLILVIEGENPCAVEYAEENDIYYCILGE